MAGRRAALKLLHLDASSFGASDLKRAYLQRARVLHPDAKTDQSDHSGFLALKAAYDELALEIRARTVGKGTPQQPHVPTAVDMDDELSKSLRGILGDKDAIRGINEMFASGIQPELRDTGGMWQMAEMMRAEAEHAANEASMLEGQRRIMLSSGTEAGPEQSSSGEQQPGGLPRETESGQPLRRRSGSKRVKRGRRAFSSSSQSGIGANGISSSPPFAASRRFAASAASELSHATISEFCLLGQNHFHGTVRGDIRGDIVESSFVFSRLRTLVQRGDSAALSTVVCPPDSS
jgi:hypothetical protein